MDALRLDHSTVAKSLRRLEAAGFVTHAKSLKDGRVTLVHLNDAGRGLCERTHAAWTLLECQTISGLTAAEQEQFVAIARKIAPSIN